MIKNREGFAPLLIVVVVGVIIAAAVVGYLSLHIEKNLAPTVQNHQAAAQDSSHAPAKFQNKVIFLKSGDIWAANEDGSGKYQLTSTSGTVSYYLVSPGLAYLTYQTTVDYKNEIYVL